MDSSWNSPVKETEKGQVMLGRSSSHLSELQKVATDVLWPAITSLSKLCMTARPRCARRAGRVHGATESLWRGWHAFAEFRRDKVKEAFSNSSTGDGDWVVSKHRRGGREASTMNQMVEGSRSEGFENLAFRGQDGWKREGGRARVIKLNALVLARGRCTRACTCPEVRKEARAAGRSEGSQH